MDRQEALGMARGLEASHGSFSLPRGLVGVFGAIVQIAVLPMFHAGQELPLGGAITSKHIRDDHPWDVPQSLEPLTEERLRSFLIASTLYQNIEHIPVLTNGPPQLSVDHATIQRRVVKYRPPLEAAFHRRKRPVRVGPRMDET